MKFDKLIESFAPIAAMAITAALKGHGNIHFDWDDTPAGTLAELDLSGDAPDSLVLASRDAVRVRYGETFAITVAGDAAATATLRFSRNEGALHILRGCADGHASAPAVIDITLPLVASVTVAGSGSVEVEAVADKAEVMITGSGSVAMPDMVADKLDVLIAGSGSFSASGKARKLKLSITGSGDAAMSKLKIDKAKIRLTGSGDASLRSDGEVSAQIMGSGDIRVRGRATCQVRTVGSGRLVCEAVEGV